MRRRSRLRSLTAGALYTVRWPAARIIAAADRVGAMAWPERVRPERVENLHALRKRLSASEAGTTRRG